MQIGRADLYNWPRYSGFQIKKTTLNSTKLTNEKPNKATRQGRNGKTQYQNEIMKRDNNI